MAPVDTARLTASSQDLRRAQHPVGPAHQPPSHRRQPRGHPSQQASAQAPDTDASSLHPHPAQQLNSPAQHTAICAQGRPPSFNVFFQHRDPLRGAGGPARRRLRKEGGGRGQPSPAFPSPENRGSCGQNCNEPRVGPAHGVLFCEFPSWDPERQARSPGSRSASPGTSRGGRQVALCCPPVVVRGRGRARGGAGWPLFPKGCPQQGILSALKDSGLGGGSAGLTPPPALPGPHPSPLTSTALRPLGGGTADLFDGDGPTAPDAVHLAVGGFLLPVQVGTLSGLKEKRRGVLERRGAPGGGTAAHLDPSPPPAPPPSSWAGPSGGAGPGRRDREGTETTSIPTGLFLHTAPYRAAQVTEPGPPLTKEQGHEIPRAQGARSPGGWGVREGKGRGEVDGAAEGRLGARGTRTGGAKSRSEQAAAHLRH